jgi:phosphoribosylformimino-5-aminoimidazole carboxamide ribotide isomerase
VVRGIGGQRHTYQPIQSRLVASADPTVIARAFRSHFNLHELYLADLDAIAGKHPAIAIYSALQAEGFKLLADAGLRTAADAAALLAAGVAGIVAGLETIQGPAVLAELVTEVGAERLVFSLDLKNGQPLVTSGAWQIHDPCAIAAEAWKMGARRLLILDLAHVGVSTGTGTEELCKLVKDTYPAVELLAGGGVRGRDDLERLRQCGVDGVLVASALHDGLVP